MIYFNGKSFAQSLTGVQRYAIQILQAMDAVLDSGEWLANDRFTLLVPDAVMQPLPDIQVHRDSEDRFWQPALLGAGSPAFGRLR